MPPPRPIDEILLEQDRGLFSKYNVIRGALLPNVQTRWCSRWPEGNDHGPDHIDRVLMLLSGLLGADPVKHDRIGAYELFLAATAVVAHDIGVIDGRKHHAERSAELLSVLADKNIFVFDKHSLAVLAAAIKCHSSTFDIDEECQHLSDKESLVGHVVRPKFVAALVRLADELDEDRRRAERWVQNIVALPEASRAYWEFCQHVTGITIDESDITINVAFEPNDVGRTVLVNGHNESFLQFFAKKCAKINAERERARRHLGDLGRARVLVTARAVDGIASWKRPRTFVFGDSDGHPEEAVADAAHRLAHDFSELESPDPMRAPETNALPLPSIAKSMEPQRGTGERADAVSAKMMSAASGEPPRLSPKPSNIITFDLSDDDWRTLILRGNFIPQSDKSLRPTDLKRIFRTQPRLIFEYRAGASGAVVECITGPGHILVQSHVELANTAIDVDELASYTIVSVGSISNDARTMYLRLRARKPLEIFTAAEFAQRLLDVQPKAQEHLSHLDAAEVETEILLHGAAVLLLVEDRRRKDWFYVVNNAGAILPETDPLVRRMRLESSRFERMVYRTLSVDAREGDTGTPSQQEFDRDRYKAQAYAEFNAVMYSALSAVGLRFHEIPLDQLYVRANADVQSPTGVSPAVGQVIDDFVEQLNLSPAMRAQVEQQLRARFGQTSTLEGGAARFLYQQYGSILVLGDPGSGKTCFVKSEILAYCNPPQGEDTWYSQHVPVFVPLAEVARLRTEESDILTVAARLSAKRGFAISSYHAHDLFSKGHLALFFDGLDEVVSVDERTKLVDAIADLLARSTSLGNRIVITSRPAAVQIVDLPPSLHTVQLRGLTEAEMRILAARVLAVRLSEGARGLRIDEAELNAADRSLVEKLMEDCQSIPGVARLARNPLLLTLLVMIYANSGPPAAKRHRIYAHAVQTLVAVRSRKAGQTMLSEADLRRRLGAIALSVYKDRAGAIPTREQACRVLAGVMQGPHGEPATHGALEGFLRDVAEATGLLVLHERQGVQGTPASSSVTFMHHSFLEYYAAVGLFQTDYRAKLPDLARQPRWHEVITLLLGILGDQADPTELIEALLQERTPAEHITLEPLLFAFECALECEVPPDNTQSILLGAATSSLAAHGPALHDPTLRAHLGDRIGRLLAACGSRKVREFLCSGLMSTNADSCAAYIDLMGHVAEHAEFGGGELEQFDAACKRALERAESPVLMSICNALAVAEQLRRERAIDAVRVAFSGSIPVRLAAAQAIESAPGLAVDLWKELRAALDDNSVVVAGAAARAVVKAGLRVERRSELAERDLAKALRLLEHTTMPEEHRSLELRCSRQDLEARLADPNLEERLVGLRLLPWVQGEERFVYDKIAETIHSKKSREDLVEVVAALNALRRSPAARRLLRVLDVDKIRGLLFADRRDLRIAAARVLAGNVGSADAIAALRKYTAGHHRGGEEFRYAVKALALCGATEPDVQKWIFDETHRRLNRNTARGRGAKEDVVALCKATQDLGAALPEQLAASMRRAASDYHRDIEVRREALLALARVGRPTEARIQFLMGLLDRPPPNMAASVCRAVSIFVSAAGRRAEYVRKIYGVLGSFRDAVSRCYERLGHALDGVEKNELAHLRSAIERIQQMLRVYREFAESSDANGQT